MRIAAWIVAGVAAVLVAAVFLGPVLIDWDGFKPRIAEAVRDATGKELRIDGPISVSLFPAIEVSASGIHLRDGVSNTEVHQICGRMGITHYEGLVNLDRLVGRGRFRFIGFPLKFRRGSGSPVRAVAVFED